MNNPDLESLLEEGRTLLQENRTARFCQKVTLVSLMLRGMGPEELSSYCGITSRTLQNWLKRVRESGWNSLMEAEKRGRRSALSDAQTEELRSLIQTCPGDQGYSRWNGPALSDYIRRTYQISYSTRSAQMLLRRFAQEEQEGGNMNVPPSPTPGVR